MKIYLRDGSGEKWLFTKPQVSLVLMVRSSFHITMQSSALQKPFRLLSIRILNSLGTCYTLSCVVYLRITVASITSPHLPVLTVFIFKSYYILTDIS